MAERTREAHLQQLPELEHWVPGLEGASGCKHWRSTRARVRTPPSAGLAGSSCRGQPASPGPETCSLESRGISMGRGPVIPGTWACAALGTVENSRSHSGPPVDRVTFHLLCLRAQANAHGQKSVHNYAHFIINFNNLRVWYGFIIVFISPH